MTKQKLSIRPLYLTITKCSVCPEMCVVTVTCCVKSYILSISRKLNISSSSSVAVGGAVVADVIVFIYVATAAALLWLVKLQHATLRNKCMRGRSEIGTKVAYERRHYHCNRSATMPRCPRLVLTVGKVIDRIFWCMFSSIEPEKFLLGENLSRFANRSYRRASRIEKNVIGQTIFNRTL